MSKVFIMIFSLLCACCCITFSQLSQKPQKKYHLSYTSEQWRAKIEALDNAKEVMRKSTYPGTVISQVQDSLTAIISDINTQISAQIAADTVKSK